MNIKLITKHHLEFVSLKEAAQARLNLHSSKCHIVGNHMSLLIYIYTGNQFHAWKDYVHAGSNASLPSDWDSEGQSMVV